MAAAAGLRTGSRKPAAAAAAAAAGSASASAAVVAKKRKVKTDDVKGDATPLTETIWRIEIYDEGDKPSRASDHLKDAYDTRHECLVACLEHMMRTTEESGEWFGDIFLDEKSEKRKE